MRLSNEESWFFSGFPSSFGLFKEFRWHQNLWNMEGSRFPRRRILENSRLHKLCSCPPRLELQKLSKLNQVSLEDRMHWAGLGSL